MPNVEYKAQRRITAHNAVSRIYGAQCPRCSSGRTEERSPTVRCCLDCGKQFGKQHRNINIDDYNYRLDGSVRWVAEEKGLEGPMHSSTVQKIASALGAYALEIRAPSGPWCTAADCPCALHQPPDTSLFRVSVIRSGQRVMEETAFDRKGMVEFAQLFDTRFPPLG